MANEDQGRDGILPDSATMWNGSEGFAFPLLHDVVDFKIEDTSPFSFIPPQVPPSPTESFHEDPVNYVNHPPTENLRGINSIVGQDNKLSMSSVLDPSVPRDMFSAQNDQIVSLSALNGGQNSSMNNISRLHEVHPKTNVKLLTGFRDTIENLYGSGGREMGNDAGLPLDINSSLFDEDDKPCSVNHGGAPQLDGSAFDGRFLSLGHQDSAYSSWGSFGFPGDSSVNRVSLHSEKLVPSGTVGRLTLAHNDYGNLPALTSELDVNPTLLSSEQQAGVHQFMATENSRSTEMGNNKNLRTTDTGFRAGQSTPHSVSSNGQFGSSEPICAWGSGFLYESISSTSSQQPGVEEQKGIHLRSSISSFQSPTSVIASKDQLDQVSQRSKHVLPVESGFLPHVGAEQGVFVSRSDHTLNSNSECKPSLKRSSSSFSSVVPQKIMRQHTVAPTHLYAHPAQPQSSMMNLTSVYPQTPAFITFSQPPHHPFPPSAQFTSLQNTSSVPAFTPFANNSSNNVIAMAAPPLTQSVAARSLSAYPSYSPAFTNNSRPLQRSLSLSSPSQIALLQNALENSSPALNPFANASPKTEPQPPYHPSFTSQVQTAKPPVAATGDCGIVFNHTVTSSLPVSTTNIPVLPVATNSVPLTPATLERNPSSGQALTTGSSGKTASKERTLSALKNSAVFQRFLQRQSQALSAFEKKSPALRPATSASSVPHIKWQGTDKPEASGFKCQLCKRDLAYTPEGPVSIPDFSPEVAVLPCGHTFHDTCLQAITPQDQSPNPPCIPCSIGDPSV